MKKQNKKHVQPLKVEIVAYCTMPHHAAFAHAMLQASEELWQRGMEKASEVHGKDPFGKGSHAQFDLKIACLEGSAAAKFMESEDGKLMQEKGFMGGMKAILKKKLMEEDQSDDDNTGDNPSPRFGLN